MCNLVVPIRTCSRCHQREPLFLDTFLRENEKMGSDESLVYMDTAQDCYSRRCVLSSEHPKSCSYCWLTCKHGHGKTREIHGGSPSYVCHRCEPSARRCIPAWRRPRPAHPIAGSGRDAASSAADAVTRGVSSLFLLPRSWGVLTR